MGYKHAPGCNCCGNCCAEMRIAVIDDADIGKQYAIIEFPAVGVGFGCTDIAASQYLLLRTGADTYSRTGYPDGIEIAAVLGDDGDPQTSGACYRAGPDYSIGWRWRWVREITITDGVTTYHAESGGSGQMCKVSPSCGCLPPTMQQSLSPPDGGYWSSVFLMPEDDLPESLSVSFDFEMVTGTGTAHCTGSGELPLITAVTVDGYIVGATYGLTGADEIPLTVTGIPDPSFIQSIYAGTTLTGESPLLGSGLTISVVIRFGSFGPSTAFSAFGLTTTPSGTLTICNAGSSSQFSGTVTIG